MARTDSSKKDFRNKSMPGANFRKHKLYMSRFEFSDYPNSDFSAVSAKQCCFIRANLNGSNFKGANLYGANFGGADLRGVNFEGATLHHVNFENALTEGANFVGASIKMCKKLKLSESQQAAIEEKESRHRERLKLYLEKKKRSPEYQQKLVERLLKKPWIESVENPQEEGGKINITLKDGYRFLGDSENQQREFSSLDHAHEATVKSAIRHPDIPQP